MMMAKPKSSEGSTATAAILPQATETTKTSAEAAVEDLERRLALLGNPETLVAPEPDRTEDLLSLDAPLDVQKVEKSSENGSTRKVEGKGGKNALLARIMAAQERAKLAAPSKAEVSSGEPPNQPGSVDLTPPPFDLATLPPPAVQEETPPPPFDLVPPPAFDLAPPPAFDAVQDSIMRQVDSVQHVQPTAPSFEDLLETPSLHFSGQENVKPVMAPPSSDDDALGIEGLSEEEKHVLLEEQRRIMEQIEHEKSANEAAIAAAQADAFDSRSTSVALRAASRAEASSRGARDDRKVSLGGGQEVALHGPERTKAAIKDGTAVLVQCVNCENWMQVTGNATLMYCPVCGVVSPVVGKDGAAANSATPTVDEQTLSDEQLAEQLQKEEYEQANRIPQPQQRRERAAQTRNEGTDSSWWDTVSNMFGVKSEEPPVQRTERSGPGRNGANPNNLQGARVAEKQPLFSCVVDSVSTAANSLGTALTSQTLEEDREGNVHGVDASSLLAVPQVSRNNNLDG